MRRNVTHADAGAIEDSHHDTHPFEYQTNTFQTCAMGDLVPDGQVDSMMDHARTLDGEEMRIGWEREQAIAQGVMARPDERVDLDNQSMPLEMIERINGEVDELERQYETAHRAEAAKHNREAASAEAVANAERASKTVGHGWFNARAVPAPLEHVGQPRVTKADPVTEYDGERDTSPRPDPRAEMESDTLGAIHREAVRLVEYFTPRGLIYSRAFVSKLLAQRVADGASLTGAFFAVKELLERSRGIVQDLNTVDPFEQSDTDLVVTITNVRVPNSDTQAQWAQCVDESTDTPHSLTVWKKAGRKAFLREGDKVRLSDVKVNAYKAHGEWQTSLAVVADTEIRHIERGNGDLIYRSRSNAPCNQTNRAASWMVDGKPNTWHNGDQDEGTTARDPATAMANRYVLDGSFGDDEYSEYLNNRDE